MSERGKTVSFLFPKFEPGMHPHQYTKILEEKRPRQSEVSVADTSNSMAVRTYSLTQPFIMTSKFDNFWTDAPRDLINGVIRIANLEKQDIFPARFMLKINLVLPTDVDHEEDHYEGDAVSREMKLTLGVSPRVDSFEEFHKVLEKQFIDLRKTVKANTEGIGIWNARVTLELISESKAAKEYTLIR